MLFILVTPTHLERECISDNITAKVDPNTLYATVKVKRDVVLYLQAGQHIYRDNDTDCTIHMNCVLVNQSNAGMSYLAPIT